MLKNTRAVLHTVAEEDAGLRVDQLLSLHFPEFSRARWQAALKAGEISLNGCPVKAKQTVFAGDVVQGGIQTAAAATDRAQDLPLEVVFADEEVIVINKPAGLVVHPAAGNPEGTLLNALLHHFPATAQLPRAGIVHRLDKDTSGLLVVAHSLRAHTHLVRQLQARSMGREYWALVHRYVTAGGTIDLPLGRSPGDRLRMAVRPDGKEARTHYRIAERFGDFTLLQVRLETGRTHQIRVHMAQARHPLVGDALYGGRPMPDKNTPLRVREAVMTFPRQALHARQLDFLHPATEEALSFSRPPPEDMTALLQLLREEYDAQA